MAAAPGLTLTIYSAEPGSPSEEGQTPRRRAVTEVREATFDVREVQVLN